MDTLAMYGGAPIRSKPLPPNYPGAVMMGEEELERVCQVLKTQSPFRYYGPSVQNMVDKLEDRMAKTLQVPYALGVSSCTAALIVAMKALGIGYGDKVIVPAVTFLASAGAVVSCNAVPIFVDVDESLNLDADDLERVMDDEVKAIIAVSILGSPCNMDGVMSFARRHGIPVIEDVAQSCGVTYKGAFSGTIGDIGVYSFQMNKVLTAGEGGAIVTRSPALFERAVRYHDQGMFRQKQRYGIESVEEEAAFVGQNYRMNEVTGAILIEQWNKLNGMLASMRRLHGGIRRRLQEQLPDLKLRPLIDEEGDIGSNLGMLLPTANKARQFAQALNLEGISAMILYGGKPVYMSPQFLYQRTAEKNGFPFDYTFRNPVDYEETMCPRAEDLLARTVFVPISPILTKSDEDDIIMGVAKVFKGLAI